MATNTLSGRANQFDIAKFKGPSGAGALTAINTLTEQNDLFKDLESYPANGGMFHQGLRTSSLPSGSLVNIGGTWGTSKGERTPFVEQLAIYRDSMQIRTDELQNMGKEYGMAFLQAEKADHLEGGAQAWANLLLKGNTTPQQNSVVGLFKRAPWNAIDSEFCFNVGGSGTDLRSALLISPSIRTVHLLYNPAHPTLGVAMTDKGESYLVDPDDSTKHTYVVTTEFEIEQGWCINDQRAVKRLANIPCAITDYSGPDVVKYAIIASLKHSTLSNRPWFLYADGDLYSQLVLGANDKTFVYTSDKNIYRTALPMISPNIIIRRLDALNYAAAGGETAIS